MPKSSGHRFNHNVRHRFRTLAMDSERARFLRHLQGAPHDLRPLFFKPSGCVLYATGFQHKQGMVGFYIVLVAALMPLQMIGHVVTDSCQCDQPPIFYGTGRRMMMLDY
jgi:hypothetical protein